MRGEGHKLRSLEVIFKSKSKIMIIKRERFQDMVKACVRERVAENMLGS